MRLLFLLLLCVAACGKGDTSAKAPVSACSQQVFERSRFTVCDPKGGRLQLFASTTMQRPVRSFAELQTRVGVSTVAFAMNAGMFDEAGRPIGMATVDGKPIHKVNTRGRYGNFHLKPNGVFIVTCGGHSAMITRSDAIPSFRCAPQLVTQSGPMLVIGGKLHPKLDPDGRSRLIRNGVGVRDGKALFVISQDPVSLGKLARFFRDGLKTPNALYFDGSVSSLWDPANDRQDSHAPLGPIIVAFKPAESEPGRGGRARS